MTVLNFPPQHRKIDRPEDDPEAQRRIQLLAVVQEIEPAIEFVKKAVDRISTAALYAPNKDMQIALFDASRAINHICHMLLPDVLILIKEKLNTESPSSPTPPDTAA